MSAWLDALFERMLLLPEGVLLLLLGLAAALENMVPPIPADMIVLLGGFLIGQGAARLWLAFAVVWLCNTLGALFVYLMGRTHGPGFFSGTLGQRLLQPAQLASLGEFYRRFGFGVIFVSRFLPVFRSLVPVFAGVSRVGVWRTAIPIALASAIWYGTLLYLGAIAGHNWQAIAGRLEEGGRWLWVAVAIIVVLLVAWLRRSRRPPDTA
jgi:membrane protein DedA with SNARE-associated domain